MTAPPIRSAPHPPDDAFSSALAATIEEMVQWAGANRDVADIEIQSHAAFWRIEAQPRMPGACPFEALLNQDQTYSLVIAGEFYEKRPIDRLDFFAMMARAIAAGRVERILTLSALTETLEAIETRIELEDGWAWVAERRVGPRLRRGLEPDEERRVQRFLPYRR